MSWFLSIRVSLNSEQIKDILQTANFPGYGLHPRNNFLANVATLNDLLVVCNFAGPVNYGYIKDYIIEWIEASDSDPYGAFL